MDTRVGAQRYAWWHHAGTIAFTGVCAYFVFRAGQRPPGLTYLDIAVHETGHAIFGWAGEFWMLVMGSGTQIVFPLLLGILFLAVRRDLLTGAVLLAWAGLMLAAVAISVYGIWATARPPRAVPDVRRGRVARAARVPGEPREMRR